MAPLRILIIGSSVAGPALATLLLLSAAQPASQKPHITMLERASSVRANQGANIDIRGAGLTIIRKLGLETAIRAATTGEEGVQFVDSQNRIWAAFPADRSEQELSTPTADVEIRRGPLAEILLKRSEMVSDQVQRAGGHGIEYIFGDYLDRIDQTTDDKEVTVHFVRSDQTRTFDIVVGADGLQSSTRKLAFGKDEDASRIKRLGMYAGFFSMPRSAATDTDWRRWFHASGRRGIMIRPSEQKDQVTVLMTVINDNDHRLMDVATVPTGQEGRSAAIEAQKRVLAEYFRDAGWECDRVIREMMATEDFYYDFMGQVKMDRWYTGRVVLLGDAGYCGSPLSGMGTTLALTGAYNLAASILSNPTDPSAAFAHYTTQMEPTVQRAQRLAPGMPYLINPETAWGVWILNAVGWLFYVSGVINLIVRFAGPPAKQVSVREFAFERVEEMAPLPLRSRSRGTSLR